MTALDRIKNIEKDLDVRCGCLDGPLLLHAFQVMRNIAWEPGNKTTEEIDQLFEERMSVCDHEWECGYDLKCPNVCRKCGEFEEEMKNVDSNPN